MSSTRILVVDDEESLLVFCGNILGRLPDVEAVLETDSEEAAARLQREEFDLLITDIIMPKLSGIDLLRQVRQRDPQLPVLVITGHPTVETAIECMKLGAADYITKPFVAETLQAAARRLLDERRLQEENLLLRRQVERPYTCGNILGHTPGMHKVCENVQRAAATNFDVLIIGETGTGKELVARGIHQSSARKDAPFVPVDCGAIPEELMESEFFGHERGAFTGAQTRSLGLMEFANKGTFFMDEIAQMPMRLQAKLLRVLQERKIRRVGSTHEISLDVRIVAASSVDLREAVQRERFRLDLYHRINVVRIELPPLRERVEDIPLLVRHFMERLSGEMERGRVEVTPEAMEVLTSYPWPGNVRELQNAMKRTLALSNGPVISAADLPDDLVARSGEIPRGGGSFFAQRERRLGAFEKEYFRALLGTFKGDVAAAAREAELPRGTVYRLLKKHGVNPTEFREAELAAA
ncbi:MAG: sigma-54-dependent Fis family transcriptional regulator [Verrucomicrobia bacterium]|nr:sigma-54-dependent Fis family transcriptional regulator [Verrucomicrobiota bacterium]